jgi:catechol-2,3-dioxygenase
MEDYKNDIADFVNWHAKSVYFYDPAGNIVEFIARFDLDNNASEPFSSSQLLSLNEVGLVFTDENFEREITTLENSYSLSNFDRQPPLPKFRAMGDDHGLFVIVPEHRNWYPTDKPSGIFPMTVGFDNGGQSYNLVIA